MSPTTVSTAPARPVDPADLGVDLRSNVLRPGARRRRALGRTSSCRWAPTDPRAGDPEHGPVSQGRLVGRLGPVARGLPRRARLRLLPPRRPGHRLSGGVALDEYTEAETQDGHDVGRVAGRAAVVHRRDRDVGAVVRRVHLDPGRRDPAAAPPRDRADPGDGRPLHRRRPLRRRRDERQRAVAVRGEPGGDERAAGAAVRAGATAGWSAGASGSRRRRCGCSSGRASSATVRTGGGARSRPTTAGIEAAILHITGWMDEYVDAAIRMQARCTNAAGRRTIVGPWVHGLPDHAYPAPNIDWLREMVRWFDRWLKDEPNGADLEPALTWFHRSPTPPERFPKRLKGEWRATLGRGRIPAATWSSSPTARRCATGAGRGRPGRARPDGRDGVDTFAHLPTAGVARRLAVLGRRPSARTASRQTSASRTDAGPVYIERAADRRRSTSSASRSRCSTSASTQPVAHLVVRLG